MTSPLTDTQALAIAEHNARAELERRITRWLLSDTAQPGLRRLESSDALDAYRDAVRAAAVPRGEVTDAVIAEAWDATLGALNGPCAAWEYTSGREMGRDFASRIAARVGGGASESALAEAKREGAREALTRLAHAQTSPADKVWLLAAAAKYAPAPASVRLSDGSVVELRTAPTGRVYMARPGSMECIADWRGICQTGADFDALKAFAATVTP